MITYDEFLNYFNFYQNDISENDFNRCLNVAKSRFKRFFPIDSIPDFLSDEERELLLHLVLIEVAKQFNYLSGEGRGMLSINKITEHVERLVWLIKDLKN